MEGVPGSPSFRTGILNERIANTGVPHCLVCRGWGSGEELFGRG